MEDAISDPEVIVIAMLMLFVLGIIIGSNGLSANNSGKRTLILWRVEAKLDLLLKQANLSFDLYQSLPPGVVEAPQRGEKIRCAGIRRTTDLLANHTRRQQCRLFSQCVVGNSSEHAFLRSCGSTVQNLNLLALEDPQLVGLRILAGPCLQRRPDFLRAVANVEAETVHAHQLGKVALRLGLPDLKGSAIAGPELDEIARLAAVCVDAEATDRQTHIGRIIGEDLGGRAVAFHHLQSLILDEFAIGNVNAVTTTLRRNLQRSLESLRESRACQQRQ